MARLLDPEPVVEPGPRPFTIPELHRVRELTARLCEGGIDTQPELRAELEALHRAAGRERTTMFSYWELSSSPDLAEAFFTEVTGLVYAPGRPGRCFAPGEPWASAE